MIFTLLKYDLKRLLVTPQAWLLLAIGQFVIAWAYLREIEAYEGLQDKLLALETQLGFTSLVAVPALLNGLNVIMLLTPLLGMRLVAAERNSGRFDLLLASSVSAATITWAKFLQVFVILAVFWVLLLTQFVLLMNVTGIDLGLLLLVWCGGLLVIATYSAAALWVSSLTRQPLLAAVATFGLLILLRIAGAGEHEPGILDWFSVTYHLQDAKKGLFNSADLLFFILFIGLFLTLSWIRLLRLRPCRYLWTARFLLMSLVVSLVISLPMLQQIRWTYDISATQQNTLKASTLSVLQRLPGELSFTAYVSDNSLQKKNIVALMDLFRRARQDLVVQYIDPQQQPEVSRTLGLTQSGEVLVRYGNAQQLVKRASEKQIAATLKQMLKRDNGWILNLQGHDEMNLSGKGLQGASMLSSSLRARGYRIRDYNITQFGSLPENTDLLIIGGARSELSAQELLEINRYLNSGGNLLWLLEPDTRPSAFMQLPELAVFPGVVVDASAAELELTRPDYALIKTFPEHAVTRQIQHFLLLPQAVAFEVLDARGWQQQLSLQTGNQSWNETGEIKGKISRDPVMFEEPGPLQVAGLWQRLRDDGKQQRLAVVGDSDFLRNLALGRGDNLQFLLNLTYWLESQPNEVDVTVTVDSVSDQILYFTPLFRGVFSVFFLLILPILLAVTGVGINWTMKRR